MVETLQTPSRDEQKLANANLKEIEHLARNYHDQDKPVHIELRDENKQLTIPPAAFEFLSKILDLMAKGKAISVIPSDAEVTTQQAAEILNVSRPHVVKLLEDGVIPFHKVGSHRRIKLTDIEQFRENKADKRKKHLSELTEQAQELNMGY